MSLLNNQPQAATVIADGSVRVLVMDPREFGTRMADPRAARWLATDLSGRLRDAQVQASAQRATSLRGPQVGCRRRLAGARPGLRRRKLGTRVPVPARRGARGVGGPQVP